MASYPVPITHNNVLNTVFNSGDFNFSSLTNTTVSGNLNVSGIGTFSSGIQNNGNNFITGNSTVSGNSIISGTESIGGTLAVTNLTTCNGGVQINGNSNITGTSTVATSSITNNETIGGVLQCNGNLNLNTASTLTLPSTQTITSSVTLLDTSTAQTISSVKTFSGLPVFSSGIQLPIPSVVSSSATPTFNCNNCSSATFTLTLSANVTGITFSNARAGGQYIVFVTGGGSVYTISNTLTGTPAIKTNYGTPLSVPISGKAILTCYYDGTNIFINSSSYA